jgi:predicted ATP-dependent endonuclease of OLD family
MFNITSLIFSNRQNNNQSEIAISIKKVTIIVGPNNSGKSTILRDIEKWFNKSNMKILKDVVVSLSTKKNEYLEFEKDILEFKDGDVSSKGVPLVKQHIFEENHTDPIWYDFQQIKNEFDNQNISYFIDHFFRYFVIRLDGRSRFGLTQTKGFGIYRTSHTASNHLSRLYINTNEQEKLSKIVFKEFGWNTYLSKSNTQTGSYIRILLKKHADTQLLSTNSETAKKIAKSSEITVPLDEFSDGINCFIGICLSILSYPFRIVLIDEPEVYLHPPTAYSLGKNLSKWTIEKHRSLIVSTHSSDFLMGCLQSISSDEISILRVTYEDNIGTVKVLPNEEIVYYAKDPLLRSSDVINALFHKSAIITEGDDDKVIYHEANNKLVSSLERGIIEDTIFLNARGKPVVHRLVKSLRKIGVPTASIYDLDVLKEEKVHGKYKTLWKAILVSSNVENSKLEYYEKERKEIECAIKNINKRRKDNEQDFFKNLDVNKISNSLKQKICSLLNDLKDYGIFIVPVGELEQWLKYIPDSNPNEDIFIKMLNKIENNNPTDYDIWKFLDEINSWISNKDRKGM